MLRSQNIDTHPNTLASANRRGLVSAFFDDTKHARYVLSRQKTTGAGLDFEQEGAILCAVEQSTALAQWHTGALRQCCAAKVCDVLVAVRCHELL